MILNRRSDNKTDLNDWGEWAAMSRGGCWAITNQLVKLRVHCPEEGSKKSSRKLAYDVYYFRTRDALEIVTGVAWISFRLDYLLPSSGQWTSNFTSWLVIAQQPPRDIVPHSLLLRDGVLWARVICTILNRRSDNKTLTTGVKGWLGQRLRVATGSSEYFRTIISKTNTAA